MILITTRLSKSVARNRPFPNGPIVATDDAVEVVLRDCGARIFASAAGHQRLRRQRKYQLLAQELTEPPQTLEGFQASYLPVYSLDEA